MEGWKKGAVMALVFLLLLVFSLPIEASTIPSRKSLQQLEEFKLKYGEPERVTWSNDLDAPLIITGRFPTESLKYNFTGITVGEEAVEIVTVFLDDNKALFKINMSELKYSWRRRNDFFIEIRYQQYYQNIPVKSGIVSLRIEEQEWVITSISNRFHQNISISTVPKINQEEAFIIANASFAQAYCHGFSGPSPTPPIPETGLLIFPREENGSINYYLTWKVRLDCFTSYVDALKSEVVAEGFTCMDVWPSDYNRCESPKNNISNNNSEFGNNITSLATRNATQVHELNETTIREVDELSSTTTTTTLISPEDIVEVLPKEQIQEINQTPITTILQIGDEPSFKNKYLLISAVFVTAFLFVLTMAKKRHSK